MLKSRGCFVIIVSLYTLFEQNLLKVLIYFGDLESLLFLFYFVDLYYNL